MTGLPTSTTETTEVTEIKYRGFPAGVFNVNHREHREYRLPSLGGLAVLGGQPLVFPVVNVDMAVTCQVSYTLPVLTVVGDPLFPILGLYRSAVVVAPCFSDG